MIKMKKFWKLLAIASLMLVAIPSCSSDEDVTMGEDEVVQLSDKPTPIQQDLFDINAEQIEKMRRLDQVIDRINRLNGSETIVIGAQQYTRKDGKGKANVFANAIKHDFKSPNPTTRWSDIIKLK